MRITALSIAGLLALAALSAGCTEDRGNQTPEQASRPNIILVMTDDQGYGDVGVHGNPIVSTPHIDQLASESVRLTNFHVDPTCSPTRAALMSGQYSLRAGVWHTVMGRHMLSDRHYTLPEALRDAGYDTAMVGKWHLGDNYPFRPQDQGFEHVLIHGGGGVGQAPDYWGNNQFDDTYFLNGETRHYPGFVTDVWFDEAIDYVKANAGGDQPFFLYLSTNAPHVPWVAPEEYIAPYRELGLPDGMTKFYAMITNLDDNMARLRAAISEADIDDNTILIFMTDNGSSLAAKSKGEPAGLVSEEARAAIGEEFETLNSHMRGGKASTYDGGHRVPFFVRWPAGDLGEARQIDDLTAHVDVMPTLLDFAGIDLTDIDTDGASLAPALQASEELPDRTLVVTNQRVLHPDPDRPYSVMQGSWRYVHAEQGGGVELFDLSTDPGQTDNLIDTQPERAATMAQAYEDWWQHATGAGTPTTRPIIGADAENPLRISAMDWLAPSTDQVPWWPGFGEKKGNGWIGREGDFQLSPWALEVDQAGTYRITLYLHDEPAQKAIPHQYAHLELNGEVSTQVLDEGSVSSTFEVVLDKGDLDVRAWFDDSEDASGQPLAAFYLYFERLPDYLVAHNALGEEEKKEKYGFEGSGIPGSPEMIRLTEEWRAMNTSPAKQRGRELFNENKYGMFIHWGLYSTLGGVWKGENMEDGGTGPAVAEWIMRRKEIPRAEYAELAKDFNPQKFDADEWVAVAKAAGMKYLVVGSKHHEGFAMFDSEVSDFNVVDATPFGRDVIKELEEACKKASLAFGVYYSNSLDWRDGGDGGLKDYGPAKNPRRAPFPNTWDPAPVTFDDYVANKALPQVHELLENYELTQIWFDTPAYIPPKHSMAFYKTVYEANPEILVNSRVGNGFGDIGIPGDNVIPDKASANTWEGIATTNNSWGYKSYDDDWKSPLETLFWLVANVSKGGNFLLNVGPDGDGVIPAESVANLLAVGDWLKVNGDAIYGTEPWKVDHEGPTQIQMKGTKHREESGTELEFESNDFWFTRKGNSVYVIALARPETGQISVQALRGHGVEAIRLLGSSQEVTWTEGAESVDIQLPGFDQDGIGYALEVTLTDADAASRPNVIVVLADDMRIGDTGHEGHPLIDTPNIDRLAADGTVFSNAFATSAACTPSRTTLLTGLYERRHGVNFNSDSALTNEAWARSYPMLLKGAGYYVGYIGKNHTPVGKNDEGVIGYGSGVMDRSFDYWYAGHKHLGFYPKEKKQHAIFNNAAADTQVEIMEEGMENFFTPDEAFQEGLNFLDSRPDDQPFALLLNFNVPHGHSAGSMEQRESDLPLYRTTYRDRLDEIELPDTYIAEADIVTPKIPRAVYNGEYIESYNYVKNPDDLKEREIRTMQTISGIDKLLGKLLDKLEEQGVADNTVIVFTSDHGLLHGEHGLGGKVFLYEPSARVPLIVHDPRQAETSAVAKSNEMVALVDIAPTLLDLAGVPAPRETQGESLVPLMRGDEVEWRKFLFLENNMTIQNYPRIEGVRTERWKYSRYFDKAKDQKYEDMLEASINGEEPIYEELFDLQSDPAETRNLTDDPEYLEILERLRKKNADLVRELRGDEPLDTYYQENKVGKDG